MRTDEKQLQPANRFSGCRNCGSPAPRLLFLWLALAFIFVGCAASGPDHPAGRSASTEARTVCWIVIDFDSIFCSPCLAPLLDFCRSLPGSIQEQRILGVLVYGSRPSREPDELYARILRKKMRGFAAANDLRFPIVLDRLHVFNPLVPSIARAFVFDDEQQVLKSYVFPLKPDERAEILRLLYR